MEIKPPNGPGHLADLWPWVSTLCLSVWGGLVQYAQRVRRGETFSWVAIPTPPAPRHHPTPDGDR